MTPADPQSPSPRLHRYENALALCVLAAMTILPLFEMVVRQTNANIPGAVQWVSNLTLIIGFVGALLATRDKRHLTLSTETLWGHGKARHYIEVATTVVAVSVTGWLAYGALELVKAETASTATIPPGLPAWVPLAGMPLGYALIALRLLAVHLSGSRLLVGAAAVVGSSVLLIFMPEDAAELAFWPLALLLVAATVLGAPIYVALGGLALAAFWTDGEVVAAVAAETVRQITNPVMPTLPLFTFTGYLLAESKASQRLVRAFRSVLGVVPGGLAVMAVVVCAFFTTFTGASGVTILALGGLLFPALVADGYNEKLSVGLLTASGSIGLLFFPSLPVILYGVFSHTPIDRMFVAGLVPGLVLVAAVSLFGIKDGVSRKMERPPFDLAEARAALWAAKWELAVPLVVAFCFFSPFATLVETAAITTAYVLIIEVFVLRDLSLKADLPNVAKDCATLIGGVLIILGVAVGLTSYLVDAEIPAALLEFVSAHVESKLVFLLALNVLLLIVGCLMDIFSALVVVVPLILPLGAHFGIDPVHLGIIFLANLELGYLTPPVGMNLFLSSYRFDKPLTQVYTAALPFLLILFVAVLLITYVPALTLAPVEWVFGP